MLYYWVSGRSKQLIFPTPSWYSIRRLYSTPPSLCIARPYFRTLGFCWHGQILPCISSLLLFNSISDSWIKYTAWPVAGYTWLGNTDQGLPVTVVILGYYSAESVLACIMVDQWHGLNDSKNGLGAAHAGILCLLTQKGQNVVAETEGRGAYKWLGKP